MLYLISCRCEHTLEAHDYEGCSECRCALSRDDALELAIDRVRSRPWAVGVPAGVAPVGPPLGRPAGDAVSQ